MILLVCGSRKKSFDRELVFSELKEQDKSHQEFEIFNPGAQPFVIIEGCCPNSADVLAEEWARRYGVECRHFPGGRGEMLSRNIKMVEVCDAVLAFWDGYSYGTAHTIATALLKGRGVRIVKV